MSTKEELGIEQDVEIGETVVAKDGKTYIKFNATQYAMVIDNVESIMEIVNKPTMH